MLRRIQPPAQDLIGARSTMQQSSMSSGKSALALVEGPERSSQPKESELEMPLPQLGHHGVATAPGQVAPMA